MRVLLVVLSLVLFLGACAKKAAVVPDASSHELLIAEEKAVVELQLSPEELEQYTNRDAEIWKKACSARQRMCCSAFGIANYRKNGC